MHRGKFGLCVPRCGKCGHRVNPTAIRTHAEELNTANASHARTDNDGVATKAGQEGVGAWAGGEATVGAAARPTRAREGRRVRWLTLGVALDLDVTCKKAHLTLVLARPRVVVVGERRGERDLAKLLTTDAYARHSTGRDRPLLVEVIVTSVLVVGRRYKYSSPVGPIHTVLQEDLAVPHRGCRGLLLCGARDVCRQACPRRVVELAVQVEAGAGRARHDDALDVHVRERRRVERTL